MDQQAIQDFYPEELSYCYGCGRQNEHGLHIKSMWEGDETIAVYTPQSYHIAIPGYVYGGLTASLIDCHGTGTAAAAAYRNAGRSPGTEPEFRFVTASLHVDFLRPTPLGVPLTLRGTILEIKERKVTVEISVSADGVICSRGKVVAVQMPDSMIPKGPK
jgi:acyl-coenzyme A thioesterase PaaI-like protein